MKTFLATVTAFGLMTSAALADCAGHAKVTASSEVDKTITTAELPQNEEIVVAAKSKKPIEEQAAAAE